MYTIFVFQVSLLKTQILSVFSDFYSTQDKTISKYIFAIQVAV